MREKVLASNVQVKLTPAIQGFGDALAMQLPGGSEGLAGPSIEGTWATSEGGELTRERENSWNGGAMYDIMVGKVTASDITLTRAYKPDKDDGWIADLRDKMRNGYPCYYNVLKQNFRYGNQKVGKEETHPNCPVLTLRTYQAVAGPEASAVTIEIVLATSGPEK